MENLSIEYIDLPMLKASGARDTLLDMYHRASQLNKNIPYDVYRRCIMGFLNERSQVMYHPLWVVTNADRTDTLIFQMGSSGSYGFFFESIMWGLDLYVDPGFMKDAIALVSEKVGVDEDTIVSSPFHLPEYIGDEHPDFVMVRDFPYVDLMMDDVEQYHTWETYLGSLKSKRRNALLTAMKQGYEVKILDSRNSFEDLGTDEFHDASILIRTKYKDFVDYQHAMTQLYLGFAPYKSAPNTDFFGLCVMQYKDGECISVTFAHISNNMPCKIVSHNSAKGHKDVGASAVANLVKAVIDNNLSDSPIKASWLNPCCETYVGSNLTGSYTQYLRHACNAEGMPTYDFITVNDEKQLETLTPPYYNMKSKFWE